MNKQRNILQNTIFADSASRDEATPNLPTDSGNDKDSPSSSTSHNGKRKKTKKEKILYSINIAMAVVIVALIICIILFVFIITPMEISGDSMLNTLKSGQKVIVLKVGYKLSAGDIVVFDIPDNNKPPIKRIIALGGDTVKFDNVAKKWIVNGVALDEPYLELGEAKTYNDNYFSSTENFLKSELLYKGITLQESQLFVLGDNRNISFDSHIYGCIDVSWIKGKVI